MKRLFAALVCIVGLMASSPAQAAPILIPSTDGVVGTLTLDLVAATQTVTITGTSAADVVDGAPLVSGQLDADTPPGTLDAIFADLVDEVLLFNFDLASSVGLGSPVWTLAVAGSAVTPITDTALAAFLVANNTGLFTLLGEPVITIDPETQAPISAVFTYALESIAAPTQVEPIPEPATIGLVGMGILAAARARRARRKNDVA